MKKLRYLAEAFLVYSLFAVFHALTPQAASRLGGFIGGRIGPLLSASRKARRHIQLSLHTNNNDTNRIASGMWENLGSVFAEYPHLRELYMNRSELVGAAHLGSLPTSPDSPAIFFSGHLANWEVSAPSLRQKNIDVDLIYRPPNNPYVKDILDKCRSMDGTLKTYPKSSYGMRQVMSALKQGRRIGILIDQKYNQGVAANFFGRPAMTSTAFIQLAKKFNCPLIPVQVERLEGANFRVTLHKPLDLTKSDDDLLREAHALLEGWIRQHPAQWLWIHRRWREEKTSDQAKE
ncbi:MAG: lipid A biosynthesis acyltransferase [Pseudobdellovibrionaceae bacterium]